MEIAARNLSPNLCRLWNVRADYAPVGFFETRPDCWARPSTEIPVPRQPDFPVL